MADEEVPSSEPDDQVDFDQVLAEFRAQIGQLSQNLSISQAQAKTFKTQRDQYRSSIVDLELALAAKDKQLAELSQQSP
jgi:hypothetical protein